MFRFCHLCVYIWTWDGLCVFGVQYLKRLTSGKSVLAAAGIISPDLVTSLSVEQSFPPPSSGHSARSLPALSFIPSVCHIRVHHHTHHPSTSLYLLLPAPSVVPRKGVWRVLGGDVLLFNTRIGISPLSCIHICKFQGVSWVAVEGH